MGVRESWKLPSGEIFYDELTEVGKKQCVTLGTWCRAYLQERDCLPEPLADVSPLRWRSSAVSRVRDSGKLFWSGFLSAKEQTTMQLDGPLEYELPDGEVVQEPPKPAADYYFRTWDSHAVYKKWADAAPMSDTFKKKAKEHKDTLDEVLSTLDAAPLKQLPLSMILFGMTYAREMVDCERYNDALETKPLQELLGKELLRKVDELALWSWDIRFFRHNYVGQISHRLLRELLLDASSEEGSTFSLYSGHDYTLLVLLAGLTIPAYEELLSFCAFILIDVYEETTEDGIERVFTLTLNPNPFEVDGIPQNDVQPQNGKQLACPTTGETVWRIKPLLHRLGDA